MTLLGRIREAYMRWQDRRQFGKLEPLSHYCVRRVLENGDEIKYMMAAKPRAVLNKTPRIGGTIAFRRHGREEEDSLLYATRLIGQEVWKAEVRLMATGAAIGYTKGGKCVDLGLAMGCVKEDISEIKGNWESDVGRVQVHDLRICRLLSRV